ncbi:MAG: DegV family protein [Clostridia bacterium]|jgi:DegV family protein with EDD domain|nr:DegV family protein [Clostridia bacterium]
MKKIRIVSDSTCDLSAELIEKYDITIIPLCIILGEKSYYDGVDISPAQIYEWSDENKTTPKTAGITFDKLDEFIKPLFESGDDIIYIGISEDMSSTCNTARIYGEDAEYGRFFVINSKNLSTGIGLQVLRACELRDAGKSAEEIVSEIEGARDLVRASFVVADKLTYLARGGRCTAVTALMANALKLHPEIVVRDGKMGVGRKYRGKTSVAVSAYVDGLMPALEAADPRRVFITHSGCEDEVIEAVRQRLTELGRFEEILITRAGGVISSHCGPNTLGVLFYEQK